MADHSMRHAHAAEKLRQEKLKTPEGCPNIFVKPKHMRTKIYHNLVHRIHWHEKKSSELFMGYFRNVKGKFDRQNLAGSLAA